MTQVAADTLGLPIERVKFELGDTKLPKAMVSGGSSTASSVSPAVRSACEAASLKLIEMAIADSESPLHNYDVEEVTTEQGRIFVAESPSIGETYQEVLQRHNLSGYHDLLSKELIVDGYAADDGVALHFIGDRLSNIVSSRPNAKAYYVENQKGEVIENLFNPQYLGNS